MRAWLVIIGSALSVVGGASAQVDAPSGSSEGAATEEVIEVAPLEPLLPREIGPHIELTFHELQEAVPRLRRQRQVLAIERAIPGFRTRFERMRDHRVHDHLDSLSPRRLTDLENDWQRLHAQLQAWQATLESRTNALSEELDHVNRSKRLWRITLNAEREEPLPEAQVERITSLRSRIRRVRRRLRRRLDEVLELQGELSDDGFRLSSIVGRINSARQRAREERAERDHEPLWSGGQALEGARPEPGFVDVAREHLTTLTSFVRRDRAGILYQAAVWVLMLLAFLWARRRFGAVPPRQHASPLSAIRSRPIASAVLIASLLTPVFYVYVPAALEEVALVLMVPALILLTPYLFKEARRELAIFLTLCAVAAVLGLDLAPAPIRRAMILVAGIGGVVTIGWMTRRSAGRRIATLDRHRRRLYRAIQLGAIPLAASVYLDIIGYVERAALWTVGTYAILQVAIAIVFATELIRILLHIIARHRYSHVLLTLKHHRRNTLRGLVFVVRVLGGVGLLMFALDAYDVRDPIDEQVRLALRRTYEFGSIELSVGDVLAFGAVIAGTFAVVRGVHLVLQRELLPRLALGQGTESAISLTVSYLLVALGVVLAFGTAGVDPEQLALLGGALGVGIGFGLQNVVSNFVAGLILVAERPIKVGDVIEIGELVGQVNRIGIRSSTVRSLRGAEVIVPNAELISGQLVNWTHSDARRRVDVAVGVGYQHNPTEVKRILERIIRRQPGVLHDPRAEVIVTGFGDSSVDFEVRAWIADFSEAPRMRSEIAQRIFTALESADIEIPFPQRDINIKRIVEGALDPERRVDSPGPAS